MNRESEGKSSGIPHLAKNERDTRISCTRHQATATCAAFIEESRLKFINANKLHRKSGGMGHPSLVREPEPGRLSPSAKCLEAKDSEALFDHLQKAIGYCMNVLVGRAAQGALKDQEGK